MEVKVKRESAYQVPKGLIPSRDPNTSLSPQALQGVQGRPGDYDSLIYSHPRVQKAVLETKDLLGNLELNWVEPKNATEAEKEFTRQLNEIVLWSNYNQGQDVHAVLRALADYWFKGVALFEFTWVGTSNPLSVELYPISPSTIQRWDIDPETGRNLNIIQSVGGRTVDIDPNKCVIVTHCPEEGPLGLSVLRPVLFLYENWRARQISATQRSALASGGVIVKENGSMPPSEAQVANLESGLQKFATGEAISLYVPEPWDIEYFKLDEESNLVEVLKYYDEQISATLNDVLGTLGFSANGSRALGETVQHEENHDLYNRINSMLLIFGSQLARRVGEQVNFEGRLPTLAPLSDDAFADSVVEVKQDKEFKFKLPTHHKFEEAEAPSQVTAEDIIDWEKLNEGRDRDEQQLAQDIEKERDSLREELLLAVLAGVSTVAIIQKHKDRIRKVLEVYVDSREAKSAAWAERLAKSSDEKGLTKVDSAEQSKADEATKAKTAEERAAATRKAQDVGKASDRTKRWAIDTATDEIAQRVAGEVNEDVTNNLALVSDDEEEAVQEAAREASKLKSRITATGLIVAAVALGHKVEQAARVKSAAEVKGKQIVGVWRSAYNDSNTCGRCKDEDGKFFDFTKGETPPTLPDPQCAGRSRCRCELIPQFSNM